MLQPLLLTLLGAFGTGLGGIMVVLQPQMNYKRLGALQVSSSCLSSNPPFRRIHCSSSTSWSGTALTDHTIHIQSKGMLSRVVLRQGPGFFCCCRVSLLG